MTAPPDNSRRSTDDGRRELRAILVGRGVFGALALAAAAWVGGGFGAGMAAVVLCYLAATLYWTRRLSRRGLRGGRPGG